MKQKDVLAVKKKTVILCHHRWSKCFLCLIRVFRC